MAHSLSSPSSNPERGGLPPVFQPASSEGPVVWRPLAESFNIVKTSRAPGGGFTVYQVVFKVWTETPERGPVIQECEVWKRYSDFQQLSKQLESIHSRSSLDTTFPSLVKAKYFERFKDSVIEERKKSAEALLYFASYYQHLSDSQPLRQFLSGAKIVGRLSPDPSMMAGSSPTTSSFPIPSYPPLMNLDPTHEHLVDSNGEEQLAAGSSLTTHKANDQSDESSTYNKAETDHVTETDKKKVITSDEDAKVQQKLSSRQPAEGGEDNVDLLAVPEAGGAVTASSGGSSVTESWEELRDVNGTSTIHHSSSHVSLENAELTDGVQEVEKTRLEVELGSVRVTEWNLAHSLKLRDSLVRPDGFKEEGEGEGEGEGEEKSSSESDSEDQKQLQGDILSDSTSSSSKPSSPTSAGIAIVGSPQTGPTGNGEMGGGGEGGEGGGGGVEGMEWWREAVAESQNVTDDIDSLVEQLETDGTSGRGARVGQAVGVGGGGGGRGGVGNSVGIGSATTPLSSRSHSSVNDSRDGTVNLDQLEKASGNKRTESEQNKMNSNYPSTDSVSSTTGKRGSRPSSRSPSPGRQRGSPSSLGEKGAYVVQAGRLIKQALSYERSAEYQEAFDLFKAGVDVLLNGVQTDQSKQRREVVRRKTAEYLKHAEELYQKHLAEEKEQVDSLEQLPAPPRSTKPHLLPDFKVIGIIGKVILVESRHTGQKYIFKVLYKSLHAMASVAKGKSKATANRTPARCPHMVRLLHHYETSTHRIFLLLEYVGGGRLVDFVSGKRERWKKLQEAATNPPPSSSLVISDAPKTTGGDVKSSPVGGKNESVTESGNSREKEDDKGEEEEDDDDLEMERMLGELASIVPPKSLPIPSSLSSDSQLEVEGASDKESDTNTEPSNSIDRLAVLRRRLEESAEPEDLENNTETRLDELSLAVTSAVACADNADDDDSSATINILPPTPTVPSKPGGSGFESRTLSSLQDQDRTSSKDSLSVEDALIPRRSLAADFDSTSSSSGKVVSDSVAIPKQVVTASGGGGGESRVSGSLGNGSSGQGSPCFSPGSQRSATDADTKADDWILRLEDKVRLWAAQIIVALDHLHNCGVVCRDLNPNNILLTSSRSAVLTYFGRWDFVEPEVDYQQARRLYIAPELCGLSGVHPAADWWSLGAILFEVLTGKTLASCHPDGVHSHLFLRIPMMLSPEAQSLLSQLLQVNPNERLGAGLAGVEELKAHPFFSTIDWTTV